MLRSTGSKKIRKSRGKKDEIDLFYVWKHTVFGEESEDKSEESAQLCLSNSKGLERTRKGKSSVKVHKKSKLLTEELKDISNIMHNSRKRSNASQQEENKIRSHGSGDEKDPVDQAKPSEDKGRSLTPQSPGKQKCEQSYFVQSFLQVFVRILLRLFIFCGIQGILMLIVNVMEFKFVLCSCFQLQRCLFLV